MGIDPAIRHRPPAPRSRQLLSYKRLRTPERYRPSRSCPMGAGSLLPLRRNCSATVSLF
jgi:hypothetical protein